MKSVQCDSSIAKPGPFTATTSIVSLHEDTSSLAFQRARAVLNDFAGERETLSDVVSNLPSRLRALQSSDPARAREKQAQINDLFHTNGAFRGWLKNQSRDLNEFHHEWLPCNLLSDVFDLGWKMMEQIGLAQNPIYNLHIRFRSTTNAVMFRPDVASARVKQVRQAQAGQKFLTVDGKALGTRPADDATRAALEANGMPVFVFQGHPGGLRCFDGSETVQATGMTLRTPLGWQSYTIDSWPSQNYGSEEFHDQLCQAFLDLKGVIEPILARNADTSSKIAAIRDAFEGYAKAVARVVDHWVWEPGKAPGRMALLLPIRTWTIGEQGRVDFDVTDETTAGVWFAHIEGQLANLRQMISQIPEYMGAFLGQVAMKV